MVNKKFKILWIASIIQLIERVCKTGFNSTLGQKFFFLLEVKNLYVTTFLKANLKLYYLFIRFWLNSDILQDFKMCFLLFWNWRISIYVIRIHKASGLLPLRSTRFLSVGNSKSASKVASKHPQEHKKLQILSYIMLLSGREI